MKRRKFSIATAASPVAAQFSFVTFARARAMIGLIPGPLAESRFPRALASGQGDPSVFFTHPISAGLFMLTVMLAPAPWLYKVVREWRARLR